MKTIKAGSNFVEIRKMKKKQTQQILSIFSVNIFSQQAQTKSLNIRRAVSNFYETEFEARQILGQMAVLKTKWVVKYATCEVSFSMFSRTKRKNAENRL